MPVIHIKSAKSKQEVLALLGTVRDALTGRSPDTHRFALAFFSAVAHSVYQSIHTAFGIKSDHGTDETGASWEDHTPRTKAYGRKDYRQGLILYTSGKPTPAGNLRRPTLNNVQDDAWRARFVHVLIHLARILPEAEAKQRAAQAAWSWVKERYGADTLLQLTKDQKRPLLKDTGRLEESLKPARFSSRETWYVPSSPDQIFLVQPPKLTMGTEVPYASEVGRKRSLWPRPFPTLWKGRALRAGKVRILARLAELVSR